MKKAIVLILGLFLLFLVVGCSKSVTEVAEKAEISVSSEKEKFADLNAEFACDLMQIEDGEAVVEAMNRFPELAEKYGFTVQELQELKGKYENDQDFQMLAFEKMNEQCPELVLEAGVELPN